METSLSFEHALHSYGLCLVSMYKCGINNCFSYYISYLLDSHLSSFQLKQNSMAHLNECLLLNIKKPKNVVFEN